MLTIFGKAGRGIWVRGPGAGAPGGPEIGFVPVLKYPGSSPPRRSFKAMEFPQVPNLAEFPEFRNFKALERVVFIGISGADGPDFRSHDYQLTGPIFGV